MVRTVRRFVAMRGLALGRPLHPAGHRGQRLVELGRALAGRPPGASPGAVRSPQPATAASASSSLDASLPPAWARSGRPPPPPPTIFAISCTSRPAGKRLVRSLDTAVTRLTLPSTALPSTMTPDRSQSGGGAPT